MTNLRAVPADHETTGWQVADALAKAVQAYLDDNDPEILHAGLEAFDKAWLAAHPELKES